MTLIFKTHTNSFQLTSLDHLPLITATMVLASRTPSLATAAVRTIMRSSQVACSSQRLTESASSSSSFNRLQTLKIGQQFDVQKRSFQTSMRINHGGITRPEPGTGIKVTFRDSKGEDIKTVEVNEGDDLLSVAHEYDIDLEGACEGSIACSTCHVILDSRIYDKLEEPGDDENDMLDLAFGLTDT